MATTYPIFLCHVWSVDDGMERINSLFADYSRKTKGEFQFEYRSVSKDDPAQFLRSNKALAQLIEEQMEQCCCVVLLAGVYEEYKKWTNLELIKMLRALNFKKWKSKRKKMEQIIADLKEKN